MDKKSGSNAGFKHLLLVKYKTETRVSAAISGAFLLIGIIVKFSNLPIEAKLFASLLLALLAILITYMVFLIKKAMLDITAGDDAIRSAMKAEFDQIRNLMPPSFYEGLNPISESFIAYKYDKLREIAENLLGSGRHRVMKHEMYQLLEELTLGCMAERQDEVLAISSLNIDDYLSDPFARSYLSANSRAVKRGVSVKRLFILSEEDLGMANIRKAIEKHHAGLESDSRATSGPDESSIRWIFRHEIQNVDPDTDFAVFRCGSGDDGVVVEQRARAMPGRHQFEVVQEKREFKDAVRTFHVLWDSTATKTFPDYLKIREKYRRSRMSNRQSRKK